MTNEQEIEKTKAKTSWQRDVISKAIKKLMLVPPTFCSKSRREALVFQTSHFNGHYNDGHFKKGPPVKVIPKKQN